MKNANNSSKASKVPSPNEDNAALTALIGKRTFARADYTWESRTTPLHIPVVFDCNVMSFDYSAESLGIDTEELRKATVSLIRTSHYAATIEERAYELHPEVYQLGLGPLRVFYTVEPTQVVVRGYSPNLPRYQTPEKLGGGFACDYEWGVPGGEVKVLDHEWTER